MILHKHFFPGPFLGSKIQGHMELRSFTLFAIIL
jgi:hypothetical protein